MFSSSRLALAIRPQSILARRANVLQGSRSVCHMWPINWLEPQSRPLPIRDLFCAVAGLVSGRAIRLKAGARKLAVWLLYAIQTRKGVVLSQGVVPFVIS